MMSTKGLKRLNRSQASIIFMYAVGGKLLLILKFHKCNKCNDEGFDIYLKNIVVKTKVTVTLRDIRPSKNISGK